MAHPTTSIVVVNYNTTRLINEIERIFHSTSDSLDAELIVVDNSGNFSTANEKTRLIVAAKNLGFGTGCNLGAKSAHGRILAFINPDIRFEAETLKKLASIVQEHRNAVVAPIVVNAGEPAPQILSTLTPQTRTSFLAYRRQRLDIGKESVSKQLLEVSFLTGAYFLIDSERFMKAGGFDEEIFLYAEDLALCERLRATDSKLLVDCSVSAVHDSGASMKSSLQKRILRFKMSVEGHLVFLRRNYSAPKALFNAIYLASGIHG